MQQGSSCVHCILLEVAGYSGLKDKQGLEGGAAQAQAEEIIPRVQELTASLLTRAVSTGKHTPIDRILHMRTFGPRLRNTIKSVARVSRKDGIHEVCIDKTSFTMGELRRAIFGSLETCKGRLVEKIMFLDGEEELPRLELSRLSDNAAQLTEDHSFLKDPRNRSVLDQVPMRDGKGNTTREKWMWSRMLREPRMKQLLQDGEVGQARNREELEFDAAGVEKYSKQITTFKEELIVLCHMTAGAPARETEIVSIMHESGQDSRFQGGVFIHQGLVELVTSYHKGFSYGGKLKIIHRFLPKEVGELLVYYLWLVEPFVQSLQILVRGHDLVGRRLWEPGLEEKW